MIWCRLNVHSLLGLYCSYSNTPAQPLTHDETCSWHCIVSVSMEKEESVVRWQVTINIKIYYGSISDYL